MTSDQVILEENQNQEETVGEEVKKSKVIKKTKKRKIEENV